MVNCDLILEMVIGSYHNLARKTAITNILFRTFICKGITIKVIGIIIKMSKTASKTVTMIQRVVCGKNQ